MTLLTRLKCWLYNVCPKCGTEKEYLLFGPGGGGYVCIPCRDKWRQDFKRRRQEISARVKR